MAMRYRLLGRSGLRVSELCLGTMTFGEDWGWGADRATSQAIFEQYVDAGGNFIDTACNYTNGTSEQYVGELVKSTRDQFVVATKYTLRLTSDNTKNANLGGNSRKSMLRSVERSLKTMQTDYIDLLYLHMWDFTTPVDEVLHAATDLISSGKVLYFAFSDTPAWVVSYAIAKAESHGLPRPVALQVPYSLLNRDIERAELPMAREHDLAVLPWGLLGGGALTGKYSSDSSEPRRQAQPGERERTAGDTIAAIAKELGHSPAQIAIQWVRQQAGTIIPILGCRSVAQIQDNLGCLDLRLSDEQMQRLNEIANFDVGFPLKMLNSQLVRDLAFGDTYALLDNHHLR